MENKELIDRGVCSSEWGSCAKLQATDWLNDISNTFDLENIVEVRFKNTRKDYFVNVNHLRL